METGKVNKYECMLIETIWKMMQFYNVHLFDSKAAYRSPAFIAASDRLYYNIYLQFRHKIEVYKYMKLRLATNPRIDHFQYIIYSIKAFFEILFTEKASKIALDIIGFICRDLFKGDAFKTTSITSLIAMGFGKDKRSLAKEGHMLAYIKFKGYSTNY